MFQVQVKCLQNYGDWSLKTEYNNKPRDAGSD